MIQLTKTQNGSTRSSSASEHISKASVSHWKIELLQLSVRTGMLIRTVYDVLKERGMDALLLVIPLAALNLFL